MIASNEMSIATLCVAIIYQEIGCHAQIVRTIEPYNSRARAKISETIEIDNRIT